MTGAYEPYVFKYTIIPWVSALVTAVTGLLVVKIIEWRVKKKYEVQDT